MIFQKEKAFTRTPVNHWKNWCRLQDLNLWPIACETRGPDNPHHFNDLRNLSTEAMDIVEREATRLEGLNLGMLLGDFYLGELTNLTFVSDRLKLGPTHG